MSLSEVFTSTIESTIDIIGGPADRAVHLHIAEANASLQALQEMIGMPPEQYAAWIYGAERPAAHVPGPESELVVGASDLVAKHGDLLRATQEDRAAQEALVAHDVDAAVQTFGRLESAGGSPAIQAIPPRIDNPYM